LGGDHVFQEEAEKKRRGEGLLRKLRPSPNISQRVQRRALRGGDSCQRQEGRRDWDTRDRGEVERPEKKTFGGKDSRISAGESQRKVYFLL